VDVPAAGTLTLNDVTLDARSGQATAQSSDVAFVGILTTADCPGEILGTVSSQRSPTDTDVYVVRLDASSLHQPNGTPVPCQDLATGQTLQIAGTVNPDGTFGHCDIIVEP